MPRTLCLALACALLLLAPARLLAEQEDNATSTKNPVNPRDTAPFPGPVAKQPSQAGSKDSPLEAIKKAANAQGDISPLTLKALQADPKAMDAVGRAPSKPANAPRDSGPKSGKPMYGDIVIHK